MSGKATEFLEEIEKNITQEKYEKLWKKYNKVIISFVAGCFLIVGAYTFYTKNEFKKLVEQSHEFCVALELLQQNNTKKALEKLSAITHNNATTYGNLATLTKAIEYSKSLNRDEHLQCYGLFQHIFENKKNHIILRCISLLHYGNLLLEDAEETKEDIKKLDDLRIKINEIIPNHSSFFLFAQEILGQIALIEKKYAQAADIFTTLGQRSDLPQSLRLRVQLASQEIASLLSKNIRPKE
jgi:hypothetical protein